MNATDKQITLVILPSCIFTSEDYSLNKTDGMSHLAESWIQVHVWVLVGVEVGLGERERTAAAAAEGLGQGTVQPGGPSTHRIH